MPSSDTSSPVERRGWVRRPCHYPCLVRFGRVHFDGAAGSVGMQADIKDLSTGGVGLVMPTRLAPGVDLTVSPLGDNGPELGSAQVVCSVPCGQRWRHRCAWHRPLSDQTLQGWLTQP
jgi:hypothetical protein